MQNGSKRAFPFCLAKLQSFFQWPPHYVQNNWTLTLTLIGEQELCRHLLIAQMAFWIRAPRLLHTPCDSSPEQGGPTVPLPPTPWHGTQKDSASHQGQQSHVQHNNLAWPQLICFCPSIHKTQRQCVWLSLHGNAGLTQVLSLFSTNKIKHIFCNSDYSALCNQPLIKLPSHLPYCVRTASLFRVLFLSLTYLLPKRQALIGFPLF